MSFIAELGSTILLFFLVFGMSATVDIRKLFKQLRNRNALLTGVSLQFIILPFLGFLVVWMLDLDAPLGITLLVVTSSPGGSYSNWWCSIFNADLALSVTMTTISTLLSVVMLPVNLILYATTSYSNEVVKSLDWTALFLSLVVVIGGISSGLICSATIKSRKFRRLANKLGNIAGIALVCFSIFYSSSDKGHDADLWSQPAVFYFAVGLPCLIGLLIATWMVSYFRLEKPERVAVSVECCYQNTGIATSVAINMFSGDELATAIGVPLFYGICEATFLAVYCIWAWKKGWTKAPRDENICVVIATSYEIQESEMQDPEAIEVVLGTNENGGLPNDLIFTSTSSQGYKIDEESLHSLTSSNSGSNGGPKTPSRKLSVDDFPLEDTETASPATGDTDDGPLEDLDVVAANSSSQHRKNGKKKYSTLDVQSPSERQRSLSPGVPPRAPELSNGNNNNGGTRLGNAVASLVSTSRGGKGAYSKASASTSFDEEEQITPATGKTID